MRLIDADALMKEFAKFVRASNNSDFEPTPTWNDAVSLTESAPTVEWKKGKWVKSEDGCLVCDQCGNPAELNIISGEQMESPYCSECGAEMEKGT